MGSRRHGRLGPRQFGKSEQDGGARSFDRLRRNRECTMRHHGAWFAAVITGLVPLVPLSAGAETIGVFTKSAGNPIARAVRAGAEVVAKANGITVFHYIPTSADNVPQQTFLVDE